MAAKEERDICCPHCNQRIHLDQLQAQEALSAYLHTLLNLDRALSSVLQLYTDLFRNKSELKNDKKLRLINEVLALHPDHGVLTAALHSTLDGLRAKQEDGTFSTLSDHTYLRKVIVSVAAKYVQQRIQPATTTGVQPDGYNATWMPLPRLPSKTMTGVVELEQMRGKYRDE